MWMYWTNEPAKSTLSWEWLRSGTPGFFASRGPTCHPTQTLSALLCGLSQLLAWPCLSCGCVTGRTKRSRCTARTWPCLRLADPERRQAVQPAPLCTFPVAVFCRRAGRVAAGSGGEVVFAARDDSPERCCAPYTAPQAAKVETRAVPFRAARSLNDWGNSRSLCEVGSV